VVLRPACPVCSQTLRANDWIDTVGTRPISIAHEIRFARQTIERRELALGEEASPDAYVVKAVDSKGKPVFELARGREAPDGWPEKLSRALVRAAEALGFRVERAEDDPGQRLRDAKGDEFESEAAVYLRDAERALEEARAEVDVRRREVSQMRARRAR